jgi:hypothetical protein
MQCAVSQGCRCSLQLHRMLLQLLGREGSLHPLKFSAACTGLCIPSRISCTRSAVVVMAVPSGTSQHAPHPCACVSFRAWHHSPVQSRQAYCHICDAIMACDVLYIDAVPDACFICTSVCISCGLQHLLCAVGNSSWCHHSPVTNSPGSNPGR